jgi:hypothetical protein
MEAIGEIAAIVNSDYVLVRTSMHVSAGGKLTVFQIVENARLSEAGLERLFVPKGEIVIVAKQAEDLYLATTVTVETTTRSIDVPSFVERMGFKQVRQAIPREFHAHVDESQSLGVKLERAIRVGDKVALEVA